MLAQTHSSNASTHKINFFITIQTIKTNIKQTYFIQLYKITKIKPTLSTYTITVAFTIINKFSSNEHIIHYKLSVI